MWMNGNYWIKWLNVIWPRADEHRWTHSREETAPTTESNTVSITGANQTVARVGCSSSSETSPTYASCLPRWSEYYNYTRRGIDISSMVLRNAIFWVAHDSDCGAVSLNNCGPNRKRRTEQYYVFRSTWMDPWQLQETSMVDSISNRQIFGTTTWFVRLIRWKRDSRLCSAV